MIFWPLTPFILPCIAFLRLAPYSWPFNVMNALKSNINACETAPPGVEPDASHRGTEKNAQTIPAQCRESRLNSKNFIFNFFPVDIASAAFFCSFLALFRLFHGFKFLGIINPRPAASSTHYFIHSFTFSPYPWGLGNKKHRRKSNPAQ